MIHDVAEVKGMIYQLMARQSATPAPKIAASAQWHNAVAGQFWDSVIRSKFPDVYSFLFCILR